MNLHPPLPTRGPACPAPLQLEVLSTGAAPSPELGAHLRSCAQCSGYVSALERERQAFLARTPERRLLAALAARKQPPLGFSWPGRWVLAGLGACALAAVLLLGPAPSPNVTLKGSGPLEVLVRRAGSVVVEAVGAASVLRPGDSLRFRYTAKAPGFFGLIELDGAGQTTVFVPFGEQHAVPLSTGAQLLPGSVVLDAAPGPHRLFSIFCATPFELDSLRAQLKAGPLQPPAGCEVDELQFAKAAAK
jgi:hypothetical protein